MPCPAQQLCAGRYHESPQQGSDEQPDRSVLTLASYDDSVGDNSLQTQMEQCIKLISVFPMLAVYATMPIITT